MMSIVRGAAPALLILVLAACGGPSGTTQDDDLFGEYGGEAGGDAATSGVGDDAYREGEAFGEGAGGGPMAGPGASIENRVVYFEFDQSDIEDPYRELLAAHASYLAANPGARVRLEGHADERGSREYNIGLGERRAQAVRNLLLLQGASAAQLSTVSYGEERPAVLGSDEEAWSLNRRVELAYER